MMPIIKILLTSLIIYFCSWLAEKMPNLAGFIVAMPITSLLTILFLHYKTNDLHNSIEFAKSILIAVPISLLFFMPFLVAEKLKLNFEICLGLGLVLLFFGYLIHKRIFNY